MASLKTVNKWEEILKCELGKKIDGDNVEMSATLALNVLNMNRTSG